jgi:hypothetical protein
MLDITRIVQGWDYKADEVTVRIIQGDDDQSKIQMRLDLGLLQMEYSGRPDGKRPHGFESLLDYYQHQLEEYVLENGMEEGFFLDPDDCAALRNEALQYYYRYLSLFHLQEFGAVERDTARNLRVFDFVKRYAEDEPDRFSLEQYRPYVIMMNTRAAIHRLLETGQLEEAIELVHTALHTIKEFFRELGRAELAEKCNEVLFLSGLLDEIETKWKSHPLRLLRERMQAAVDREDYETAARIRDQIKQLLKK